MAYDPVGTLHVLAAGAALATGTAVAVAPKGTPRHARLGRAYLVAMLALNASALLIYDLTGRPNPFHLFALISLASVLAGWRAARRRGAGWRTQHARSMLWSYVGLWAATTSELVVRLPAAPRGGLGFGAAIAVATLATVGLGGWLVHRAVARIR